MVGSLSFLSSAHCRAACSSRENPGGASLPTVTAAAGAEEDDATDNLELMGLRRNTHSGTYTGRDGDQRGRTETQRQEGLLFVSLARKLSR